jgi:hypothetical protein
VTRTEIEIIFIGVTNIIVGVEMTQVFQFFKALFFRRVWRSGRTLMGCKAFRT